MQIWIHQLLMNCLPGRTPITTVVVSEERRAEIVMRVKNACVNEKRPSLLGVYAN